MDNLKCVYREDNNTIEFQRENGNEVYYVDLDHNTPGAIADTFFHVTQKTWLSKNHKLLVDFINMYRDKMNHYVYGEMSK